MHKPVLVILAAGMGSRYGGLKQIDPVDPQGHLIIDFSIYDAVKAGFSQVVCIIKEEMQTDFDERLANRVRPYVDLTCVYQRMEDLPQGYAVPPGRTKPWGTSHALLACLGKVTAPFAVINADDYYGPGGLQAMYDYLSAPHKPGEYAMVGYPIENTLTRHGSVTRGICTVNESGMLQHIQECRGVQWGPEGMPLYLDQGKEISVSLGTTVSMNFWGFDAALLDTLAARFPAFLDGPMQQDPLKAEYLLPTTVGELLLEGQATVKVLPGHDQWFGVTYREDKPLVEQAIAQLKAQEIYPEQLWR